MKHPVIILALILCSSAAFAQAQDSLTHHYDSLANTKLHQLDSSSNKFNNKVDSIQLKFNNILNPNVNQLSSKFRRKKLQPSDTLRASHELDSMKRGLTHKIDSLKSLNLPADQYTAKLNQYNNKLDSLNKLSPTKYIDLANNKLQQIQNGAKDIPTNNVNLPNGKIPGVDGLPNTNINSNVNIKTPGIDNPLGKLDNPVDNINGLNDVNQLKEKAGSIQSLDQLQDAKDKLGDVNSSVDKLQAHQGDLKKISTGNLDEVKELPSSIEKKAGELGEIKELSKQTAELDKAKGMIPQGNSPEALKELGMQEMKKQAINHFQGKEEVLQQAMDKLSKIKSKYSEVSSLADLPKRPPNPMKGKPLIERILPGITIQVQKYSHVAIDINPVVSYRFNSRINGGLGWNERLSFAKWNKLSSSERIFGPRVFGSFGFKQGFAAKAEIEKMNTLVPVNPWSSDGSRQWVWSAWVGLKKDYKFMGKVKGNVQILYNMYDDHRNSPYADRLNVRMGFEFPMKKKPSAPK